MTNEFGKPDDTGQDNNDGTDFGQTPGDDNTSATDNKGIDSAEFEALRKRDEAAQAHIPNLESENAELRDKLTDLESKLASATTIDEALDRISNNREGNSDNLDASTVTQIVEQVLEQNQTQAKQDSNWTSVQNTLTESYGDWKTADAKVQERAMELDIPLQDATTMAKNNPKAFLQLFTPQGSTNTDSSSGVRSGGSGQTVAGTTNTGNTRDHNYYKQLRKDNPILYWKTDTQLQMRRDLYNN